MSATKFSSCVDIKSSCPLCKSGFYKTPYDGEIVEYFCDMETDGGKSTDNFFFLFDLYIIIHSLQLLFSLYRLFKGQER